MNRTELVDAIAVKADISKKDADAAVKAFIEVQAVTLRQVQLQRSRLAQLLSSRLVRHSRIRLTQSLLRRARSNLISTDYANRRGCLNRQPLFVGIIIFR